MTPIDDTAAVNALALALATTAGTRSLYYSCSRNEDMEQQLGMYAGYQQAATLMLASLADAGLQLCEQHPLTEMRFIPAPEQELA